MNDAGTQRNVFVLALDEFNRRELESVDCGGCTFHGVLNPDEVLHSAEYPFEDLLAQAERELDSFEGSIDALFTHWDFPMSVLVPLLSRPRDLRSPSLESVLRCADKYWSRLEQSRAVPEFTPQFAAVDPFAARSLADIGLEPPFWLKPVAAFSSQLGFRIEDEGGLKAALEEIREGIDRIGDPFERVLEHAVLPGKVERVGGRHCIAEEYLTGLELAHEGAVFNGQTLIHGALDMVREDEVFTRMEYPSTAPAEVLERMNEVTGRLLSAIGFDQGCFNVEYFWEPESDRLTLIEVNPRISQSHAFMFEKVDGRSNHQVAVDVALGRSPTLPKDRGPFGTAAKFALFTREDGVVERVPGEADFERAREVAPDLKISVVAEQGVRLSDLVDQDSYSFHLAEIYLAAEDQPALLKKYEAVVEALDFKILPV